MPKVSVIIPTYNRAHYLKDTIDSVLCQSYKDLELIVADDGSTDGTQELLKSYSNKIKYLRQENQGSSIARNNAVQHSSGEYLSFLDSDDVWLPNRLEDQVAFLDQNPDYSFVCGEVDIIDEKGRFIKHCKKNKKFKTDFESLFRGNFIHVPTTLLRRKVFDELGGFDVNLRTGQDYDLWLRLVQKYKIKFMERPFAQYRHHGGRISREFERKIRNNIYMFNKMEISGNASWFKKRARIAKNYTYYAKVLHEEEQFLKAAKFYLMAVIYNPLVGKGIWPSRFENLQYTLSLRLLLPYFEIIANLGRFIKGLNKPKTMKRDNEITSQWNKADAISRRRAAGNVKVSVIIPTYNRTDYIKYAIESVLNQSFRNFEIIVIDDGSTIDMRDVLKKYEKKIQYVKQANQGLTKARTAGARLAKGEYLAFLDDDDAWAPQKLEYQVDYLDKHPDCAFICADVDLIDSRGNFLQHWKRKGKHNADYESLYNSNFIHINSTLIRRQCFDDIGGFDLSLNTTEDYDLWLRLSRKFKFQYMDIALSKTRKHDLRKSQLDNVDQKVKNYLKIFHKKEIREGVSFLHRRKRIAEMYYYFGQISSKNGNFKKAAEYGLKSLLYNPLIGFHHWPRKIEKLKYAALLRILFPYFDMLNNFLKCIAVIIRKEMDFKNAS